MKLEIFLLLLACCFYLATARPNDVDPNNSKDPEIVENSENEEFTDEKSQSKSEFEIDNDSDDEHTENDAIDQVGEKPLHELAELLYSDHNVSISTMVETLKQLRNMFEITMINKSTDMYKQICDYVKNTQWSFIPVEYEVDEIFKVYRHEEQIRYEPYEQNFNRQLLFHGTPRRNLIGILKNGLKVSPPEAEFSGSTYGRGIYFSDSILQSAPFSCINRGFSLVFLCEVALGVVDIRYETDNSPLKAHSDSVQGLGIYYPHPIHTQPDGLKIPNGVLLKRNDTTDSTFNIFAVSDEARVKITYLIKLKVY